MPLGLPAGLVALLGQRRVRTAGHIAMVFAEALSGEKDLGDMLGAVLGMTPGSHESWEDWVGALQEALEGAADQDLRDAARLGRGLPEERMLRVVTKRALEVGATSSVTAGTLLMAQASVAPPTKRWRTGRTLRRSLATNEDARAGAERAEHKKWAGKAVELLVKMQAPVIMDHDGNEREQEALEVLFTKRRPSTLRARVRYFARFLQAVWLRTGRWAYGPGEVLIYLADLAESGVGFTVPKSVVFAVDFFERFGGVDVAKRVCRDPLVEATAAALEQRLPKTHAGRCEALRYPVLVVISIELAFLDEQLPLFLRFVAGFVLTKIWGCLRYDDTRGVNPSRIRRLGRWFEFVLDRTKTSTMTRTGEQKGYLHVEASLSGEMWVEKFMGMLTTGPYAFGRDYLLPLPDEAMHHPVKRMAEFSDAAALCRSLLDVLRTPVPVRRRDGVRWVLAPWAASGSCACVGLWPTLRAQNIGQHRFAAAGD